MLIRLRRKWINWCLILSGWRLLRNRALKYSNIWKCYNSTKACALLSSCARTWMLRNLHRKLRNTSKIKKERTRLLIRWNKLFQDSQLESSGKIWMRNAFNPWLFLSQVLGKNKSLLNHSLNQFRLKRAKFQKKMKIAKLFQKLQHSSKKKNLLWKRRKNVQLGQQRKLSKKLV